MNRYILIVVIIFSALLINSQIVITEIMYNDGGTTDSLEFIEIMNNTSDSVAISDFVLKGRTINFKFPEKILKPGGLLTVCKNSITFQKYFRFYPYQWDSGGLNNNMDSLLLISNTGDTLDRVDYLEDGEWPSLADGKGYSLSLCDPAKDNNRGLNWQASPVYAGFYYHGTQIHANPGKANYCSFDIQFLKQTDGSGNLINKNKNAYVDGTVCGANFNPSGLQFSVVDHNNEGIWIYSSKNFSYNFHEGDKIELWGRFEDFNGQGQISPDSVLLIKKDSVKINAKLVTKFEEEDEGNLLRIENVRILNFSQWTNSGSGFNVDVADSQDTFVMRVDKDINIFGKQAPSGNFSVTGILGQYDKTSPFLDGYQLFPRYTDDISPYNIDTYPLKTIGEMTHIDAVGVSISKGTACELRGVVYGINLRPNGLQFTIIDDENNGIGMFSNSKNYGYSVREGDFIATRGKIDQYSGLMQMAIDTIILLGQNSQLVSPATVNELNENTESQLIKIMNLSLKDPSQWKGTGESVNVTLTDGNREFIMRIDNDCDLSTKPAPDYKFDLTGLGGQFDTTSPYLDGYQIFPRYSADIEKTSALTDSENEIMIYPNPSKDKIYVSDKGRSLIFSELYTVQGRIVRNFGKSEILEIDDLNEGIYILKCHTMLGVLFKRIVKI